MPTSCTANKSDTGITAIAGYSHNEFLNKQAEITNSKVSKRNASASGDDSWATSIVPTMSEPYAVKYPGRL